MTEEKYLKARQLKNEIQNLEHTVFEIKNLLKRECVDIHNSYYSERNYRDIISKIEIRLQPSINKMTDIEIKRKEYFEEFINKLASLYDDDITKFNDEFNNL